VLHCFREKREMRKIYTVILLMLVLPLLFSSCDAKNDPADSSTNDETTVMESTLKIVEDGRAVFTVVYPDEPGAELYARIRNMVDAIKEATGATLKLKSDFISWNTVRDPEAYEILVGRTNYDETSQVLSELRACDYAIRAVGNKIVITAHTDELIRRAVSYFCKNLIEGNLVTGEDGKVSLLLEEYTFLGTVPVESLKIDGIELREYKIVYAASEAGYDTEAKYFRDLVAERYGYVLEVVPDKDTSVSEHEILIGPTNRSESAEFAGRNPAGLFGFSMGVQNGKFVICGRPYSCKAAAQRFSSKYLYTKESSVSIPEGEVFSLSQLDKTDAPLAEGANLRIMTANILAEFESWGGTTPVFERAEIFAALLKVYSPDVVGVQEVTDQWYKILPGYIDGEYAFLWEKTPDGLTNYSSILYKKNKFNVVDSGVMYFSTNGKNNIRLVTWGVFEDIASKERFILFNTHWSWESAEIARTQATEEAVLIGQVTAKYNYPIFCTADYNTVQLTENYNYFLEQTGLVDAKYVAQERGVLINISGGCGSLGTPRGETGNSIDHIFISPSIEVFAFETVVINRTFDLSDHSPKYCDVKLK
jgi:endonuclease/exonuclease/phosphatase family metal-dependent hydrolase